MITLQILFQLLNDFNIFNYICLCILSILLNTLVFKLIQLNYLGLTLKNKFNYYIDNKLNIFTLYMFIFFYVCFIILNININIVYLDEIITVKAQIDNTSVELNGDVLNFIFENIGEVATFTTGARIGALFVAKQKMNLMPRLGVVAGTATGLTIYFKAFQAYTSYNTNDPLKIKFEIDDSLKKLMTNETNINNFKNNLNNLFNLDSLNTSPVNITKIFNPLDNIFTYNLTKEDTKKIITELDKTNPNWKTDLLNSSKDQVDAAGVNPLILSPGDQTENINPLIQRLIETFTDQLYLNIIIVYLLIMLTIIIISKFIINKDYKFEFLNKYPLGSYLSRFLVYYVSVWQKSSNMWILFILFIVILFNFNLIYGKYIVIEYLKNKFHL